MGIMLLVLTPVPYVDASSASGFRSKWQRIMVGTGGLAVELLIAAVAMFVWVGAESGTLRLLAYRTVLIAGVSTILFNANPLLRYDGYYILADLIEIPNLRGRANAYLGYLWRRFAFGLTDAEAPETTGGERAWFVAYGILSFVYRTFVMTAILFYLAARLFYLGRVLAVIGGLAWALMPVVKGLKVVFTDPALRSVRGRAVTVTAAVAASAAILLGLVPVPYRTSAEGVVWIPEEAFVRAGTDGFIERVAAASGARVAVGDVLLVLSDPVLASQQTVLVARAAELEAQTVEYLLADPVKAETARDELGHVQDQLAHNRQLMSELTVRSRANGTFVLPSAEDLPGRFVKQGTLLGHVVELDTVTVRTVVPQDAIDLVRSETRSVSVRLSEQVGTPYPAVVRRLIPGASEQLPSRALGTVGGGGIVVDPRDQQGLKAVGKVFQVDVELPSNTRVLNLGGRGYVRFDHGRAPLIVQFYRMMRQLFLSRFNV
jgi:putative peptide zinc metalloprotease protein